MPHIPAVLGAQQFNGEWGMIEIESSGAAHGCLCLDGSTASVFREAQFLIHLCSDRTVC